MPSSRIQHVVAVTHRGGHIVHLRFDDGVEGDIDLRPVVEPFTGVLAPLADPAFVAQVRVHPEFGTITWPGELDLDPVVLYYAVKGIPVPDFGSPPQRRASKPAAKRGRSRGSTSSAKRVRRRKTRT